MASIVTNRSAMQALQSMRATDSAIGVNQRRLSTGLKVSGTKDDSAAFTIAQTLRGDVMSWDAVNSSLARARSIVDVATSGAEQISDIVNQLKAKALGYSDDVPAETRTAIRADMEALIGSLDTIAKSSEFDGVNLLTGKASINTVTRTSYSLPPSPMTPASFGTPMAALSPGSIVTTTRTPVTSLAASPLTPSTFQAALASFGGSNSQDVTVDAGPVAGRVNLLLNAFSVPDVVEVWQSGVRVAATGQAYASNGAAVAPGTQVADANVLSFDYDPARGQMIEFRVNHGIAASGTAWTIGGLELQDPAEPVPGQGAAIAVTLEAAAEFDPQPARTDPEQVAVQVGILPENVRATYVLDGGSQAGRVDMLFDAFASPDTVEIFQGGVRVAASGEAYAGGGGAVGPASAVTGRQVISFDYDPAKGPISFAFNDAGADPDSAWLVAGLTLSPTSASIPTPGIQETTTIKPGLSPIRYAVPAGPSGTMSLQSRDLTSAGLGLVNLDWAHPETLTRAVSGADARVREALRHFGTTYRGIEGRLSHASRLIDSLEGGIGQLVDADMGKEAARLHALQVREQLGIKSLAIANSSPSWLGSLFG